MFEFVCIFYMCGTRHRSASIAMFRPSYNILFMVSDSFTQDSIFVMITCRELMGLSMVNQKQAQELSNLINGSKKIP